MRSGREKMTGTRNLFNISIRWDVGIAISVNVRLSQALCQSLVLSPIAIFYLNASSLLQKNSRNDFNFDKLLLDNAFKISIEMSIEKLLYVEYFWCKLAANATACVIWSWRALLKLSTSLIFELDIIRCLLSSFTLDLISWFWVQQCKDLHWAP